MLTGIASRVLNNRIARNRRITPRMITHERVSDVMRRPNRKRVLLGASAHTESSLWDGICKSSIRPFSPCLPWVPLPWAHRTRLQPLLLLLLTANVSNKSGNLLFAQSYPQWHENVGFLHRSCTVACFLLDVENLPSSQHMHGEESRLRDLLNSRIENSLLFPLVALTFEPKF